VTCSDAPNEHNSVVDDNGRLWGWQNDASCAYKLYGKGSSSNTVASPNARMPMKQQLQAQARSAASFKDMQNNLPTRVSVVWESAPTCSFAPNDANAVPDTFGRLWGWQNNSSCAFRVSRVGPAGGLGIRGFSSRGVCGMGAQCQSQLLQVDECLYQVHAIIHFAHISLCAGVQCMPELTSHSFCQCMNSTHKYRPMNP
jgi:hypothetical protein